MLEQGVEKTHDSVAVRVKDGVNKMAEDVETLTTLALNADRPTDRAISESSVPEERCYVLNRPKALSKKLEATERTDVAITETGGRLKIEFSAGMYELFKLSADEFYASVALTSKCQKTPVYDSQGNNTETKYKLTSGRNNIYTLNMYHTKSSCLINGKQSNLFMERDMP